MVFAFGFIDLLRVSYAFHAYGGWQRCLLLGQIFRQLIHHITVMLGSTLLVEGSFSAGLNGTYYADPNMQNAVFERRDIRIDFDWGEVIKPGGSLAYTKLGSIPTDNYSVRWEGQLIPRFSEVYTIVAEADSTRIWIKPSAQTDWQDPLITHWPTSESSAYQPHKAVFTFEAGQKYDIRIDYRERTGPARMRLFYGAAPVRP